jgi:hypothetical protein
VNAERQWKTVNGASFNALMVVTVTLAFHFGMLFGALPAVLNLPLPSTHLDKSVVVPFLAVLASDSWLAIVRNGKGVRLAEELKKKGEDSITICQIVTLGIPLASAALFFITFILAAHLHPPTRTQIHSDGSYSSSVQSQAR